MLWRGFCFATKHTINGKTEVEPQSPKRFPVKTTNNTNPPSNTSAGYFHAAGWHRKAFRQPPRACVTQSAIELKESILQPRNWPDLT